MNSGKKQNAILGAAFLMATSAIGPGFLTQTTVFTQQLLASFGFVILLSILLDIGAQLNVWRILVVSSKRAPIIANELLPGLGYFITGLIVMGGLAFNIGNIGGSGLGLEVLTGLNPKLGAVISCFLALFIFWMKEAGDLLDRFTKILGLVMMALTLFIALSSNPPVYEAITHSFMPSVFSAKSVVTLVGGTVGGYICFAGGHRLLDAGYSGTASLGDTNRSAVSGILITAIMRIVLFLAALGVVSGGAILDPANPAASVFKIAAGNIGYTFFGVVLWCAAITSVVGAAYTSISFLRNFSSWVDRHQQIAISIFIIISTLLFAVLGNPVKILVTVGALNGLILPIALAVILIAARHKKIVGNYKQPLWLDIAGWLVVAVMTTLSILTIKDWIAGLL
ncbi:MAG: divalent metal cation transporter [Sediminibacterium sp.]|nr:divalent metal cation transporter [Sediminibacterium sp.]